MAVEDIAKLTEEMLLSSQIFAKVQAQNVRT